MAISCHYFAKRTAYFLRHYPKLTVSFLYRNLNIVQKHFLALCVSR